MKHVYQYFVDPLAKKQQMLVVLNLAEIMEMAHQKV